MYIKEINIIDIIVAPTLVICYMIMNRNGIPLGAPDYYIMTYSIINLILFILDIYFICQIVVSMINIIVIKNTIPMGIKAKVSQAKLKTYASRVTIEELSKNQVNFDNMNDRSSFEYNVISRCIVDMSRLLSKNTNICQFVINGKTYRIKTKVADDEIYNNKIFRENQEHTLYMSPSILNLEPAMYIKYCGNVYKLIKCKSTYIDKFKSSKNYEVQSVVSDIA